MRIVIADYSGHPFQVQLSRELARRGHTVLHLYFAEFQTPKGRLTVGGDDPETLSIEPIFLGKPFAKHSLVKRRFQEVSVGKLFADRISAFEADVVLASNLPLDALRIVAACSKREGRAFVFWQQDIYSVAIERILRKRLGPVGAIIGKYYKAIERSILRSSQAVVVITEDFRTYLRQELGVSGEHICVVENWAPLDEIVPRPKDNQWARANGLFDKNVLLYTGTLGMKHDPCQIIEIAESIRDRANTEVVVISEGPAADWLAKKVLESKLNCLRVMNFQPFEIYSDVLGSATILLSILEPDSGVFSVPSKVLSYLCAGRPIVLLAPEENLASRTVVRSGAGIAVSARSSGSLTLAISAFLDNPVRQQEAGACGRIYAEQNFDIKVIGNRFVNILAKARSAIADRDSSARKN